MERLTCKDERKQMDKTPNRFGREHAVVQIANERNEQKIGV